MTQLQCKRCGYTWTPRNGIPPAVCPRCKSVFWMQHKERAWERQSKIDQMWDRHDF